MPRPLGIYVHYPYCTHRCPYCDFAVTTERPPGAGAYARAVVAELALRAPAFLAADLAPASLYVGGGTPSLWEPDELALVLAAVRARFPLPAGAEVTLEVNPESQDRGRLRAWREAGVNRLSIGAQSFDRAVLAKLGRRHDPDAARRVIRDAADALGNASVDLIYAGRRSSPAVAAADARAAVDAGAVHVSAYALTLDPAVLAEEVPLARLADRQARAGRVDFPGDEEAVAQAEAVRAALRRAGLRRYEISNFARPGFESVHNRLYWRGESYVGLGAGAYGFLRGAPGEGGVRYGNLRDAGAWRAAVEEGRLPTAEEDRIGAGALANEGLMLALRTREGAPSGGLSAAQAREAAELVRHRLAVRRGDRLVLTGRGLALHSAVAERLFDLG